MKNRKDKAWSAFWLLQRVWSSSTPIQMKMRLFKASVLSVFLYGSETWVISPQMRDTINAFQTACLRVILDITHEDRVTNNTVYARTNMHPMTCTIQDRQLRFLGHSLRHPADHIVSMYGLYCPPHGRPSRGQPSAKYISKILQSYRMEEQNCGRLPSTTSVMTTQSKEERIPEAGIQQQWPCTMTMYGNVRWRRYSVG